MPTDNSAAAGGSVAAGAAGSTGAGVAAGAHELMTMLSTINTESKIKAFFITFFLLHKVGKWKFSILIHRS
jgi:hypothetical protein